VHRLAARKHLSDRIEHRIALSTGSEKRRNLSEAG